MGRLHAWAAAARPATLPAAVVPVLLGAALAAREGLFRAIPFAATLAGALAIQVGTNLANDYFDWRSGADNAARLGPPRASQSGLIPPARVLAGAWIAFGFATLCGIALIAIAGWPIAILGAASIAAGILYTGGPRPYGYVGLGDLVCFLFFGPVAVVGTYFIQTGKLSAPVLAASVPVGLTVTAILVVNNLRDIDTDRAAGKRTLAVRIGRGATRAQYAILVGAALALPPLLGAAGLLPALGAIACAAAPLALSPARAVFSRTEGPALNDALRGTARFHLVFGVLFALGILLGGAR